MPEYFKISEIRKKRRKFFRNIGLIFCTILILLPVAVIIFEDSLDSLTSIFTLTFFSISLPILLAFGFQPLKNDLPSLNFTKKDLIEWSCFSLFSSQIIVFLWIILLLIFAPSLFPFSSSPSYSIYSDIYDPTAPITSFLLISLIGPIIEEFIFRSILFHRLSYYGTSFAVFSSSLLFSLVHLTAEQLIPTFFLGIVFALAKVRHSLYLAIILHCLNNAYVVLFTNWAMDSPFLSLGVRLILLIVFGRIGIKFFKTNKPRLKELWNQSPIHSKILKEFLFSPFVLIFILLSSAFIFLSNFIF